MKKFITCFSFLICLSNYALSQVAIEDSTMVDQYIEITLKPTGIFAQKPGFSIDYGDSEPVALTKQEMTDIWNKIINMKSMVAVLNYFGYNGWKLINTTPIFDKDHENSYKYYLKKASVKMSLLKIIN